MKILNSERNNFLQHKSNLAEKMEQLFKFETEIQSLIREMNSSVLDFNNCLEEIEGSVISAVEEIQRLERIYQAKTCSNKQRKPKDKDEELKQPELGFKNELLDDFFN